MTPEPAIAPMLPADQSREAQPPIRLMIVDDSAIARAVLSRMLSNQKDMEVVALVGSAGEAVDALRTTMIDIVLLDVEMPGTTGFDALPEILKAGRGARVIIVSSLVEDGAEAAIRAMSLGAADTLPKPGAGNFGGRFAEVLADRLRRVGRANRGGPAPAAPSPVEIVPMKLRPAVGHRLGCLALGASTGGLHALSEFLRALPTRISAPILITQHLPPVFMPFFARQIEAASGRPARVAENGMALTPEQILVAPGDGHLTLERAGSRVQVRLTDAPASSGCMPSVDTMLWSVSEIYGRSSVGVVFSGMGRDGLVGSARIVDRGGVVLVQDQQSSAVWGMPRAVAEAGLASAILAPAELAMRVTTRAEASSWR